MSEPETWVKVKETGLCVWLLFRAMCTLWEDEAYRDRYIPEVQMEIVVRKEIERVVCNTVKSMRMSEA